MSLDNPGISHYFHMTLHVASGDKMHTKAPGDIKREGGTLPKNRGAKTKSLSCVEIYSCRGVASIKELLAVNLY